VTAALVVLALGMGVQIEGGPDCPAPSEIHERMRPLLPPALWASDSHRARVAREGTELTIDLRDQNGVLLAHRTVPIASSTSCADQAGEAAVILAAWEVRLQTGDLGMPDLPNPPPPPPTPIPVEAPQTPSGSLELGAGALVSLVSGQAAFGGSADLVLGGKSTPWIGVLSLTGVGTHSLHLGPGLAEWDRFALALGPGLRFRFGAFALEPSAFFSACWVQIRGEGFDPNLRVNDYDLALGVAVRLSLAADRFRPWISASAGDWLRGQQVEVTGLGLPPVQIPKVEFLLALGLSFELQ
jgi:hypothetical protein